MDSAPERAERLTVLFTDISGSTELYAQRGDTVGFALADACLRLMEEHVVAGRGRVVKRVGDGVMAVFETAEAALNAAVTILQAMESDVRLRTEGIHARAGAGTASAVLMGHDVYGDVVNVAARLLSYAGPDEIFLTEGTFATLPPDLRNSVRLVNEVVLRGRPDATVVYEYNWKEDDATVSIDAGRRRRLPTLAVEYGEQRFSVTAKCQRLRIGRAPDNDLVVEHDSVSRYHAELRLRGDKFELSDKSTNGSYLIGGDGSRLRVAREDVTLGREGSICVGSERTPPVLYRIIE